MLGLWLTRFLDGPDDIVKILPLIAPLLLAAPAAAQVSVWHDDFNDGVIGLNWGQTYNAAQPWNVDESGGKLNFHGINTQTFSAPNETYIMLTPVPSTSGEVTLRTSLEWSEHPNAPGPGGTYLHTRIAVQGFGGVELAAVHLYDVNQGTEFNFWAGGFLHLAGPLPQTSSADVEFTRDGSDAWTFTVSGAAGNFSGTVSGSSPGSVEMLEIKTTAINLQFGGAPLGTVSIDSVELLVPGTSPTLTLSGPCPGQMVADASDMTAFGTVIFGWGFPGVFTVPGGTCAGVTVPLAIPTRLATVIADSQGDASLFGTAPSIACGNIGVAALDLATCTLTNIVVP